MDNVANEHFDISLKFLIIGDSGCGKSCLMHQFLHKTFKQHSSKTIGLEFGARVITLGSKLVKCAIWDTAGQERFRAVTRSYYRGAVGALIVFDVTDRDTFLHLPSWLNDARTLAWSDVSIFIVGNKVDDEENREVTMLEAATFAQEHNVGYIETSALTGLCVEESFVKLARAVIETVDNGALDLNTLSNSSNTDGGLVVKNETTQYSVNDATASGSCAC